MSRASSFLVAISGLVVLGPLGQVSCQDQHDTPSSPQLHWPQFRGPNCSGIANTATQVPLEFGPEKNVRWKTALPAGAASPCIWGDHIFLTGFNHAEEQLQVFSINRVDGQIEWERDVPADEIEKVHSASTPASGTTATDGERVYVYFGSAGLFAYDLAGNLEWSIKMPIPETRNGSGTSPVVAGELVLINRDETSDPYLLAVDRKTGKEVWKHRHIFQPAMMAAEGHGTPIVWRDHVILHTHEGIRAINLDNGQLVWQANAQTTGCSTPVIAGDTLYVATWHNLGEPALRQELPGFQQLLEHDKDDNGKIAFGEVPNSFLLFDRPEAADEKGVRASLKLALGSADVNKDREITMLEWTMFSGLFSAFLTDHGLLAIKLGGQGNVTETHVEVLETKNIPEVPSPLVHHGRLYLVKNGGIVSCYSTETGERIFRKRVRATGSYYASPIAVGDHIFLASSQGTVTVLRSDDSLEVVAENKLDERILATPAAVGDILYVRTSAHLYAFSDN